MSSEGGKSYEAPVPSTSILPTANTPPKRFLGSSSHLFTPKKLGPPPVSLGTSNFSSSNVRQSPSSTCSQLVSPPKLTRIPTIVLTPVDITKISPGKAESKVLISQSSVSPTLPPPPPLIKMPISTRKEKRSAVTSSKTSRNDGSESAEEAERQLGLEPPRKRTKVVEKSGESSKVESTTPRKIIQEIFGPDKSKKPKGKGRKKRRGVTTPKKKILADKGPTGQEEQDEEADGEQEQGNDDGVQLEEVNVEEIETGQEVVVKEEDDEEPKTDDNLKSDEQEDQKDEAEIEEDIKEEDEGHNCEEEEHNEGYEGLEETASIASSSSRTVNKRKAKVVANQRLKRLQSQSEDGCKEEGSSSSPSPGLPEEDDESECATSKDTGTAAGIHSRRSTTDGSSKSGGSYAQQDSESSVGEGNCASNSNDLEDHRQQYNPTPYSNISDDDYDDDGRGDGGDNISMSDLHEHKDSDVDSTYSWKPVRAAAAAALEQVTKNQGSGSTGLPGDAEAKAAAAAERRARKINRYKGRNRRTLLFKSSSSKKYTAIRNNRYSAQPTIAPKVFHHGHYFQAGDIVFVELADGTPIHGQIRGLMMDHYGEISAGIRFLAPKHPIYAFMEFEPIHYAFRYDIPEKLIKIDFVNFVMHLNLDYFDGHPSYRKIEKNSLYTRMGKSLQKSYENNESDSDSSTDSSESSSEGENGDEKKERKKQAEANKEGRRRHISDSSTDVDEAKTPNADEAQEKMVEDDEQEENDGDDDAANGTESTTRMEVDVN